MGVLEGFEITGAILAFIFVFLTGYWIFNRKKGYWADKAIPSKSQIPLPFFHIIFHIFSRSQIHVMDKNICSKYGRVFGSYMGERPIIFVAEPELIKSILVKDFSSFSSRRPIKMGNAIVDNMVSNVEGGDKWRNLRNTITPAFSSGKLKNMLPLVSDCAQLVVQNFEKYSRNGEYVDCKRLYGSYTLDVIANVAFGTKLDSHNDPDNKFVYHAKRVFSTEIDWKLALSFAFPVVRKFFDVGVFKNEPLEFFKKTTLEIIKRREANKEVRNDVLQIFIDGLKESNAEEVDQSENANDDNPDKKISVADLKRKPLTKDEVIAQTVLFFLAGYDTTANTLSSVTYYLATNPECQKKALDEVDRIWEGRNTLDPEALFEAKYIGAAIDEALRLSPPTTKVERTCVKNYQLGNTGVTIPEGMIVQIPSFVLHHDAEFFPEPEEFRPERFLGESKTAIMNSYTYLPFGAGPRNCIAMRLALMEIKLCLLYVLKNFEFRPSEKTKIPMEYVNSVLLQPKDVILYVKRRN